MEHADSNMDNELLIKYAKNEEKTRIIGIIEFYISTLGDTSGEKTAKHLLNLCIKTIEHNSK